MATIKITKETLKEMDCVSYVAFNNLGKEIFVAKDMSELVKTIAKNNIDVDQVVYEDSGNTCPQCGIFYYTEDLLQLENDIICESCHSSNK